MHQEVLTASSPAQSSMLLTLRFVLRTHIERGLCGEKWLLARRMSLSPPFRVLEAWTGGIAPGAAPCFTLPHPSHPEVLVPFCPLLRSLATSSLLSDQQSWVLV